MTLPWEGVRYGVELLKYVVIRLWQGSAEYSVHSGTNPGLWVASFYVSMDKAFTSDKRSLLPRESREPSGGIV